MSCSKSPRYEFSTTCGCTSCVRTRAAYIQRIREQSRERIRTDRLAAARRAAQPDWVAVDRLLASGPQPGVRRIDRRAAAHYLLDHGYSQRSVAEKIGVTTKSVERIAARMRKERSEHQGHLVEAADSGQQ